MAHPDRAYLIDSLYKKLLPIESKVVWDEKNNIWDTCRRAWLTHDAQSDYHLVIQDDALIGKLFHFRLMKLLEPGLDVIYSLYLGNRKRFHEAVKPIIRAGGGTFISKNIHHEIALIFPVKRIEPMIKFCDLKKPDTDKVINEYVNSENLKVYFPLPTLVDHLNVKSLHNLNKSPIETRKSIWFY